MLPSQADFDAIYSKEEEGKGKEGGRAGTADDGYDYVYDYDDDEAQGEEGLWDGEVGEEGEGLFAPPSDGQPSGVRMSMEPELQRLPEGLAAHRAGDILPFRASLPWVSLPRVCVTLPVPPSHACTQGWSWGLWRGSGTVFGVPTHSAVLAPTHSAIDVHSARAGGRLFLPIRLTVRAHVGLVRGPLGRLLLKGEQAGADGSSPTVWAGASLSLCKALVELHMLRHGPCGELPDGKGTRKPRVLHSWRDPVPTGATALPGMPHTLGLEYETLSDEHLLPSDLPAQDLPSAARVVAADAAGLSPTALHPTRLVTMRHAVSYTLQPPDGAQPDCVHEITLSAPASSWDELWGGEEEGGHGAGVLLGDALLPPGALPTPRSIGLAVLGLKVLLEQATVTGRARAEGAGGGGEDA